MGTNPAVRFAITVNGAGVSYLGSGLWFPTAWADDFGDTFTTDPATHPFGDVFKQVSADQFQEGILGKLSFAVTVGLFTHNHLL